jgi:RNA polymerase sigma-70 factor (ECF subfamily)
MNIQHIKSLPSLGTPRLRPPPSESTLLDDTLVRRFCSGDLLVFEVLVTKYQRRVTSIINATVRNQSVADELTQETLMRAYRSLPGFRFESAFSSWLYAIARNLTLSYFREQHDRADNAVSLDLVNETTAGHDTAAWQGSAPNPEEQLSQARLANTIQATVTSLSPSMREALLLREIQNLSYQEIADQLKIPLNTIRSLIFRARATIATDIRPLLDGAVLARYF